MTQYNNFAVRPVAYKKLDKIIKVTKLTKVNQFELLVDNEYKRLGLDTELIKNITSDEPIKSIKVKEV